jgi:hypothetical protein
MTTYGEMRFLRFFLKNQILSVSAVRPSSFFLHARTSGLSSLCGEIDNEQKIALWKILILTAR